MEGHAGQPAVPGRAEALKDFVTTHSKAPVNGNENDNDPAVPLGEGKAGMIIDAGWKVGTIEKATRSSRARSASSRCRARTPPDRPVSSAARTSRSPPGASARPGVRVDQDPGREKAQTDLATTGGVIPNSTSLLTLQRRTRCRRCSTGGEEQPVHAVDARSGPNVESGRLLQDMLVSIFSGKKSVADGRRTPTEAITKTLNS